MLVLVNLAGHFYNSHSYPVYYVRRQAWIHGLSHFSLHLLEFPTLQIVHIIYPKTWGMHNIYLVLFVYHLFLHYFLVVHIQKREECTSTMLKKNFRVLVKTITSTEPSLLTLWKIMSILHIDSTHSQWVRRHENTFKEMHSFSLKNKYVEH